jgi:hypothetical protein
MMDALEKSIKKWEAIVDGTGCDKGPGNCNLCRLFYLWKNCCEGCPVKEKTKFKYCERTPYQDFQDHIDGCKICQDESTEKWYPGKAPGCDIGREIAQREVDFLKGLRK